MVVVIGILVGVVNTYDKRSQIKLYVLNNYEVLKITEGKDQ